MAGRVVFDLDGTLIDSARDIQWVANAVLKQWSCAPITLAETRSFIGEGTPRLVEQIRHSRSISENDQEAMLREFMEIYPSAVTQTTTFDGVEDALHQLRSQNFSLGVCTNKPYGPTIAILRHLNLEQYFDVVVGGDTYPERKPHPMPLMNAMGKLPKGPELYIGDSHTDADAAKGASIPFVLYLDGYTNSDASTLDTVAQFDRFQKLPQIVSSVLL